LKVAIVALAGLALGVVLFFIQGGDEQKPPAVAPVAKNDPVKAWTAKLGALCELHQLSERVYASIRRYRSWQTDPAHPHCNEPHAHVWRLYRVERQQTVDRTLKACGQQPPCGQVEQATRTFAAAYSRVAAVMNEAERYYDHKDYKDDGCAKGRALHTRLEGGMPGFERAERALHDALEQEITARLEASLARAGQTEHRMSLLKTVRTAREIARTMRRHRTGGDAALLEQTRKLVDQLESSAPRATTGQPEDDLVDSHIVKTLVHRVDELVRTAKEYARQPGDKQYREAAKAFDELVSRLWWAGPTLGPSPPAATNAESQPPEATGASALKGVVRRHMRLLAACSPGRLQLSLRISATGRVLAVHAIGAPPQVRACVERIARRWVFPASDRPMTFSLPVTLR